MATYKIDVPVDEPEWIKKLMTKITTFFETLDCRLTNKLDDLKSALQSDIKAVENKANQALDLALANESSIRDLKQDLFDMKRKCHGLREENKRLLDQCDSQESYSRRSNLIIRGIKEQQNETESMCLESVTNFFVTEM